MDQPDQAELLRRFQSRLAAMDGSDLKELLDGWTGTGGSPEQDRPPRRRERRPDVVTYRVRVDLDGTEPPLWRRLDLASDMLLDEVHGVLQAAFGWTDSHLHEFSANGDPSDPRAERYLSPVDVAEGEDGVPEHEVRLDELLADAGDELFYVYDFGDDWRHTVRLEEVLPRDDGAPRAACTAGQRPAPAENCGGVDGYELCSAASDPSHADHARARAEIARMNALDGVPDGLVPTPFVLEDINEALVSLRTRSRLSPPLAELVLAVQDPREQARLLDLIDAAALDGTAEIDVDAAARMVRPYAWLLDRVGEDGITLTGAGYLPPAHVNAAMVELGMADEWIGKNNREVQTLPVLVLRETAQKVGLLRKHRGNLRLTARGRRLRTDPVGLWWHLAERMPVTSRDAIENQAGLLVLIAVAAGLEGGIDATVVRTLHAIGWRRSDGRPVGDATGFAWDTRAVLRRLNALTDRRPPGRERPTPGGVAFARAALSTWP
jgi:hypothetical protein